MTTKTKNREYQMTRTMFNVLAKKCGKQRAKDYVLDIVNSQFGILGKVEDIVIVEE